MRVVFLLFDTLNRRSLECYGGDVKTPNFSRLAERSVTFDNHYVGSLPCMPARRDIMTGRLNFMHRSWGPLEPFDHAFPEILMKEKGVYSHLVTDHAHYWKDGGATYHTRYDSCELIRGQEMDAWKGLVDPPIEEWRKHYHPVQFDDTPRSKFRRSMVNRHFVRDYADYPSVRTVDAGLEFLDLNRRSDNWLLQIECFDPHEPFDVPEAFREGYPTDYSGPILDFPPYGPFEGADDEIAELRAAYAATLTHCDRQLGRILDAFDRHDLWKDTALIVTTDHGFLLGEHDLWAKNVMPVFNEVAHIPLFVFHPEHPDRGGDRRTALTQTIDLMPSLLALFDVAPPPEVQGVSLLPLVREDGPGHEAVLYGQFGAAINITDGRYTYFRYPDDIFAANLNQYTLMPTHIASMFSVEELRNLEPAPAFDFTQNVPLMRIPVIAESPFFKRHGAAVLMDCETRLFDLQRDPHQAAPIDNPVVEANLVEQMTVIMRANDAPEELFDRFYLQHGRSSVEQHGNLF